VSQETQETLEAGYLRNKVTGYYHAVLRVVETGQRYTSTDMFMNRGTAMKQAQWWKYESLILGQVVDF
jgi:hypothetical protein